MLSFTETTTFQGKMLILLEENYIPWIYNRK